MSSKNYANAWDEEEVSEEQMPAVFESDSGEEDYESDSELVVAAPPVSPSVLKQHRMEKLNLTFQKNLEKGPQDLKLTWTDKFEPPAPKAPFPEKRVEPKALPEKPVETNQEPVEVSEWKVAGPRQKWKKSTPIDIPINFDGGRLGDVIHIKEKPAPQQEPQWQQQRHQRQQPISHQVTQQKSERGKKIWKCEAFSRPGGCRFGDDGCNFAHYDHEVKAAVQDCFKKQSCPWIKWTGTEYENAPGDRKCFRLHPKETIPNFNKRMIRNRQ